MPPEFAVRRVAVDGMSEPAGATWSNCLVVGKEIVMSGITARGGDGKPIGGLSMKGQTLEIFKRLAALTAAAGGGLQNVYKLIIYVTDMTLKDEVNLARRDIFRAVWPCSTLVEVKGFAFEGFLVEVDAFANLDVDMRAIANAHQSNWLHSDHGTKNAGA